MDTQNSDHDEEENALYSTKWWDYRATTPEGANLLFLREMLVAQNSFLVVHGLDVRFDEAGNPYRKEPRWLSLAQVRQDYQAWRQLVHLRKFADRKGMPYYLFWQFAFTVMQDLDTWRDELCALKSALSRSAVVELFQEYARERLLMSKEKFFLAEGYMGHPLQQEYAYDLVNRVVMRYPTSFKEKVAILNREGKLAALFVNQLID